MVKTLRYLFVSMLMLVCGSAMADTDVTFTLNDPNAIQALGITLPEAGKGTKVESVEKDGVTIAATTAAGKTDTRIFQGSGSNAGKYDFRIYANGTLTFTAGDNNIKKVFFTGNNLDKLSGEGYEAASENKSGEWTGDQKSVTLTATGTATIYTIVVTFGISTDTRTVTTIEFAEGYETRATCGKDESVTLPTASVKAGDNVINATVTWTSSNENVTVNGNKLMIPNGFQGEVTIKAEYAGDATNKPSSKSYKLTIYKGAMLFSEMVKDVTNNNEKWDNGGEYVSYWFVNEQLQSVPNTVTYANGNYIYMTDGTSNLLFYGTNSKNLKQGDVVSGDLGEGKMGAIWGKLYRYNKLPEFSFTDLDVKVQSEGATVTPTTITADKLAENINAYVKIENAEFVSSDGKSSKPTYTFKVGETSFAVYDQWNVKDELEAGAKYTIVGMGAVYKENYQLYYISSEKTAEAGIRNVAADQKQAPVYNLAGQRVMNAQKGLFIIGGKKVIK